MASDSDNDIFITQSNTCHSSDCDTDTAVNAAISLMGEVKNSDFSDDGICDSDILRATQDAEKSFGREYPAFSDISDDELVAVSQKIEADLQDGTNASTPTTSRFKRPLEDSEVDVLSKRIHSDATHKKINWVKRLFDEWLEQRNVMAKTQPGLNISEITVPLEEMTRDELNYTISRVVMEVKKQNGKEYPGNTLYELVISLQLYLQSMGKKYQFLNEEWFSQIKNTLDNVMKKRAASGIGTDRKQAVPITVDEENRMWEDGILGTDNPEQFFQTLVYLIGLNFALRGGNEHRALRCGPNSQFTVMTDADGERFLRYREDVAKNNAGGLKHRRIKRKVVDAYENIEHPDRCIVKIYQEYMFRRPHFDEESSPFYLRPLQHCKESSWDGAAVWYSCQPVGRQKLANVVQCICKTAGLAGKRTNHSLRVSAATRMFEESVDEQLIKQVTGHRSDAVRDYKRANSALRKRVSNIVQGHGSSSAAATKTGGDRNITINLNLKFD